MSISNQTAFEKFLREQDEASWSAALAEILHEVHEVDRSATEIWFRFWPLKLWRALSEAEDAEALARRLLLKGSYYLKDQVDASHKFLYGHRYWPAVKRAVEEHASAFQASANAKLADEIRAVAKEAAARAKADVSLVIGITAAALMTVVQAGMSAFVAAAGEVLIDKRQARKSAEEVLSERAKDDSQGLFGFLKTVDKEWTVTYDEADSRARFKLINDEELASAAARDQSRNWREADERCIEGPIPVECRSASCGTCWVGVLGGAEKLTEVKKLEGRKIKEFGYIETDEARPLIRLACMARASGAVSIVIPPWNGVFGKYLKERKQSGADSSEIAANETLSTNGVAN
ncbi:MAG: (2Fe-2S)-binding protein [Acidobacteria bacterium]|nr:(2Fe-2S)-binding protein [Acidobacteriota bacterium]